MRTAEAETIALRKFLKERAVQLTGGHHLPIQVEGILRGLGLPEVEVRSGVGRKAHGVLQSSTMGRHVVVFRKHPRTRDHLSPSERETVAHEIGHYLVEEEFSYRPQRTSEYWGLEDLCNEFARILLLPLTAVSNLLDSSPTSSAEGLQRVQELSRWAQAPTRAVSVRLVPHWSGYATTGLRETVERRDTVRAEVRWSVESEPILRLNRGKHIHDGHPLALVVAEHAESALGERRQFKDDSLEFASARTGLRSLLVMVRIHAPRGARYHLPRGEP